MTFDKTKLNITPASFQEANELRRVVGEAVAKEPLRFGKEFNTEKILDNEITGDLLSGVLGPLLSIVNSRDVESAILVCAKRCLYNKQKIDQDFFEDVENRELYFPILFEIAKENLSPFFGSLGLGLTTIRGKFGNILKRK